VHHHEGSLESQVAQQRVKAAGQGPAQAPCSPAHDALDVFVDFRQEVPAPESGLVVEVLGEGLERHSKLMLSNQAVEVFESRGLSLEPEMGEQAIGSALAHGRFPGSHGTPEQYPKGAVSFC
jgi:hypothetical protein